MPIIFVKNICKEDAEDNPDVIFVFADNDDRKGGSSIAKELRGEDNAIGIRVKRTNSSYRGAYYDNEDIAEAENNIDEDFEPIEIALRKEEIVIMKSENFCDDGVLQHSPEVHEYLTAKIAELRRL